ncbi:NACHT domain-containing protein [Pseudonocardia xinjiangensis]|uniref:NACHT domain-containing protein n=1 Tax=Pseudonocardia xinjiangensis TaxID=75289 RepID=UPI003D8CAF9A
MIKVIAFDVNRKGDLFTERMSDLIHAIGFEIESVNLHRSGRELDILANHRLEKRRALIECKAQDQRVGGADINKFVGVLDAERRRIPGLPVAGYFISLSGFRDSAKAQESELGNDRCALLGEQEIRTELEAAKIIVPLPRAIATASTLSPDARYEASLSGQLLATEYGWVWQVYFDLDNVRSAYALIHADGYSMPEIQASTLAAALTGDAGLTLFTAEPTGPNLEDLEQEYLTYIRSECGTVTHEGLPADTQVSAGVDLVQLYVPLYVEVWRDEKELGDPTTGRIPTELPGKRISIGSALQVGGHISVVGAPGSGKSTLLNRIALSYANVRDSFRDSADLPPGDYLPILLRCRDVTAVGATFMDLVSSLPEQFGRPEAAVEFKTIVMSAMRRGRALILVDGLDEIASPGQRVSFVRNLRNLLTTYPTNHLVLTSREPGFRPVAGALADYCGRYRLSDMDDRSISMLVSRWDSLIPRRSQSRSSHALTAQILGNDRIRLLASSPLLLTTLLLVERWVGDLPRRRSVLYDKAIEVLLMTWNVEGHEPLNLDEVLPQLSYVAYEMTTSGLQRLSASQLTDLLRRARNDMPDVLGYARLSPNELLERIELRSSLIVQAGLVVEAGRLQQNFEFRHLTFQEYLTALACVKGWNANELTTSDPKSCLSPHYGDESWTEVIPLAAVLSGRSGTDVIQSLLEYADEVLREESDDSPEEVVDEKWQRVQDCLGVLVSCLVDEVTCRPETAREAFATCVELGAIEGIDDQYVGLLLAGKFAPDFRDVVRHGALEHKAGSLDYASVAGQILEHDLQIGTLEAGELVGQIRSLLNGNDLYLQISACGLLLSFAYLGSQNDLVAYTEQTIAEINQVVESLTSDVIDLYTDAKTPSNLTSIASWALAWMLDNTEISNPLKQRLIDRALNIVFKGDGSRDGGFSCWLISQNCLTRRGKLEIRLDSVQKGQIRDTIVNLDPTSNLDHRGRAAFVLAYMAEVVSDVELTQALRARTDALGKTGHPEQEVIKQLLRVER